MPSLSKEQRRIVLAEGARNGDTLQKIADRLGGLSRERVRQLLNREGWNNYRMMQRKTVVSHKHIKPVKVCDECGKSYDNRRNKYCSEACYKVRCYRYHTEYINRRYATDAAFRARISGYNKQAAMKRKNGKGTHDTGN